jgi:hypothetical protein
MMLLVSKGTVFPLVSRNSYLIQVVIGMSSGMEFPMGVMGEVSVE